MIGTRSARWRRRPPATIALLLGLLSAAWIGPSLAGAEDEKKKESAVSHTPAGEALVRLDAGQQENVGVTVAPLTAYSYRPEVCAFGILEDDPANVFMVRAPIAGVVRAAEDRPWPALGQHLDAGVVIGWIEPRLTPVEQVDLATRRAQARADVAEVEAGLTAARSSFESKQSLNADNKIVTDRALEEARAKVAAEEARLSAAREIVQLIEAAQGKRGMTPATALQLDQGGEVVELSVRLGEAVEPGRPLARVADYRSLMARITFPIGVHLDGTASGARIATLGEEAHTLVAEQVAQVRGGDAGGGSVILYRVAAVAQPLRPGAPVLAYVPTAANEREGVLIPRSAVVREAGRAWVYVQTADDSFTRREAPTDAPTPDGWFAGTGFAVGQRLVVEGAAVLLSEERKSQIEKEEAAEE